MKTNSLSPSAINSASPAPISGLLPLLHVLAQAADRRLRTWKAPPNMSRADWFEEMRELEIIAVWEIMSNPRHLEVVLAPRDICNRIIAKVRVTYRREWAYGLHITAAPQTPSPSGDEDENAETAGPFPRLTANGLPDIEAHARVRDALDMLSPNERCFIERLYYEGSNEAEVAAMLGITQPAVCKRKQKLLSNLRKVLAPEMPRRI